jgi:hypothetical protein
MLNKILSFLFPRRNLVGSLDLNELARDLDRLVTENQIKLLENEAEIEKIRIVCEHEKEEFLKLENGALKRCKLRKMYVQRKRMKRLGRCSKIYNDNIDFQEIMVDRLENMRVAGMKKVTEEQLNELTLDLEERYREHEELISDAMAVMQESPDVDNFDDDLEIRDLMRGL